MREILLTINGNRELPFTATEDLISQLSDNNSEISFRVTVSPDKVEINLNQGDGQNVTHYKTKIVRVEII